MDLRRCHKRIPDVCKNVTPAINKRVMFGGEGRVEQGMGRGAVTRELLSSDEDMRASNGIATPDTTPLMLQHVHRMSAAFYQVS